MAAAHHRRLEGSTKAVAVLVALAMLFGFVAPAGANPFVDVPAGHWAYAALEQLSAAALIDGYAPGFFTGARRLTRYEMALSLAEALARLQGADEPLPREAEYDLDGLIAAYNAREPRPLTANESALLRAMIIEFAEELSMLGYVVPSVSAAPAAAQVDAVPSEYVLDGSFVSLAREMLLGGRGVAEEGQPPSVSVGPVVGSEGPSPRLVEQVAQTSAVPLGNIGSTVLFTDSQAATLHVRTWGEASLPSLDGSIHISEYALPGTFLSDWMRPGELTPFWPSTETRVAVEGISVTPFLQLAGERAERTNLAQDVSATSVRATVQLGRDVSLSGNVRAVEPGFEAIEGEAFGVGLSVRLGDVVLSTERDIVQWSETSEFEQVTTWALEYSLAEQALVRAGWQTVSDTRSRASVDVNVPVPLGALRLGLAYEGRRTGESGISMTTLTIAGLDLRVAENAAATAAISVQDGGETTGRTASLGLRYTLSSEAALMLGYKWINFSGGQDAGERLENVTTAEFTIRF